MLTAPIGNPYVGPRTFTYEQQHLFFGRDREARDLVARVISERLLLFYAQSGAGKSSLLNTRLIPRLREQHDFIVLPVGRVSGELPANVATVDNVYIFNLLLNIDHSGEPTRFAHVTLSDFLARLVLTDSERNHWRYEPTATPDPSAGGQRYALIIDQFEEILTTHAGHWPDREDFFRQLDQAMAKDPNLWVVLTLREEYVAALEPYATLLADRLRARFYMERMNTVAALAAIREPARLGGHPFAPKVAEKLVDDLSQVRVLGQVTTLPGQYVEPVQLQVVCYQLWEQLQLQNKLALPGLITEADRVACGDVNQALVQFYETTLTAVLAEPAVQAAGVSERTLRAWFEHELITGTGIRNIVLYNEVTGRTGSLVNELPNVAVDQLVRRYLLRSEPRAGGLWVELVHDRYVLPILEANRRFQEQPNVYALLIGVDYYFPNRLPNGAYYPSLNGCVRDVRYVEEYLTHTLAIPPSNVVTLTISNFTGTYPPEDPKQWPTYQNIVAKLRELVTVARPGDQLYVHYAGHGGRAVTAYPQLKGDGALDNVLVPTDIGNSETQYLRDVELAYFFQSMLAKDLMVTFVLDSCFSGSATRGVNLTGVRSISAIDTTPRPTDSLVAPLPELLAAWHPAARDDSSIIHSLGSWLTEGKGFTLLAACRDHESAYEYPFNGRQFNGVLTYWLIDALTQLGPNVPFRMLFNRIMAKVHSQFEQQTPVLAGELNRLPFSTQHLSPTAPDSSIQVLKVEGERVLLNAGEVHGMELGRHLAIYAPGAANRGSEKRLALIQIVEVGVATAWAKIVEQYTSGPLAPGVQAMLLQKSADIRLQRGVAIIIDDVSHRQQLESAITTAGQGLITVAGADGFVDFQLTVTEAGEYELWDTAGAVIPNLRPPIAVAHPGALAQVVQRLLHLARYRNVQELDSPNLLERQKLKVELSGTSSTVGGIASFEDNTEVTLKITNNQAPNPANPNDPSSHLNICVLDLASDWSISQVYPQSGSSGWLEAGQTIELPFVVYVPDGYTEISDILKIFAVHSEVDFHWLELPPLDQPTVRAASRPSSLSNSLEQTFAMINAGSGETTTRNIQLNSATQDQSWAVWQVEVHVSRLDMASANPSSRSR